MAGSDTHVSIQNLCMSYVSKASGELLPVLEKITLDVTPGEVVALVGPSGCGKSTLLNLVAGLSTWDSGTLDVGLQDGQRARIGYIFQQPRLLDWISVERNLTLAMDAAGIQRGAKEILAEVGLADYANVFPSTLSGGQQQRVAVARGFAIEPDILLLDEPFSALDELTARQLRSMLQRLWSARPRLSLFVTHNTMEAALLADRIVVMSARPGRIVKELYVDLDRPRNQDSEEIFAIHREVIGALQ